VNNITHCHHDQEFALRSSRHASILKQFAIALELFNKKSVEYQLLVWLCEQLQAAHLSGAFAIFNP
jgi:hypothetical protein